MMTDSEVMTWAGRTQESKNKEIIHSKDYGLLGDGTDETLKLNALLQNTNSLIVFEKNKTYCFKGSLMLKGNTILFNSSKLLNLEAHEDWSILVYTNTYIIDGINLTVQSGHGLRILESNVKCESIFIESLNESLNIGCMLSSNLTNSFLSNIEIGSIYTKNFSSHILIYKVLKSKIDSIWMNNYVTGLYFRDCQDSTFGSIYARGLMTRAIGSAGQNGVLLESTLDNNTTKNLSFNVVDIEDSAEHGIRFGGVYAIDNVHMNYIKTRNTGAGSAATGGGGLKILGGNRTGAFNYHTNISIGTLINEDCSTTKGLNNFAALIISHVKHIHINKHIVNAVHSTYSAKRGLHLASCEDVTIGSQSYDKLEGNAVLFYTNEDPMMSELDKIKNIRLSDLQHDGTQSNQIAAVIFFSGQAVKVSDVHIVARNIKHNFVAYSTSVTSGSYENINIDVEFKALTATQNLLPPLRLSQNSSEFIVNVTGPFFGTYGPTASNGSKWIDTKNDTYFLRKAGAWRQFLL